MGGDRGRTRSRDTDRLHAMADAMAIDYDKLLNLVALCKAAWEL